MARARGGFGRGFACLLVLAGLASCAGKRRKVVALDGGPAPLDAGAPASALRGRVTDERGAPLARVRVMALAVDGHGLAMTDSDAAGLWALDVPPGPLHLETRAAGRVARAVDVTAPGEVAVVAMRPGVAIGGIITVAGEGADVGLTGALVVARPEAGWLGKTSRKAAPAAEPGLWRDAELRSARSGAGGGWALSGLASGFYRVTVQAEGHAPVEVRHVVAPGLGVDVALARQVTLAGRVVDAAGAPAAGARVEIAGSGLWPPRLADSDAKGGFRFEQLTEGIYEVRARRGDGEASAPLEGVELFGSGSGTQVVLKLGAAQALVGKMIDAASGGAVAGARVALARDVLAALADRVESAADGSFRLPPLPPGEYVASASAPGYLPAWGQLVVVPPPGAGGGADVTLALTRGASLRGWVHDGAGAPVRGASVEVLAAGAGGGFAAVGAGERSQAQMWAALDSLSPVTRLRAQGELGVLKGPIPYPPPRPTSAGAAPELAPPRPPVGVVTGADGSFAIEGIPPGRVRVVASHPDLASAASAELQLVDRAEVTLVLRAGAVLAGRVTDDLGRPLASVLVTAAVQGERAAVVTDDDAVIAGGHVALTDGDGRYRISALAGSVRVEASLLGYLSASRRVVIPAAAADAGKEIAVDLTLVRADRELGGRVVDPLGFALAGARVRAVGVRGATATSIDGGWFTLTRLGPPPWRIEVSHPDYPSRTETVTSEQMRAEVALTFGGGISGRVTDARTRGPLTGVRVALAGPEGARAEVRPDATGAFSALALAAGGWTLTASAPGHAPLTQRITVRAATRDPREITQRDVVFELEPAGSIAGRVLDARGAPVRSAAVTLLWRRKLPGTGSAVLPSATTDTDGRFLLTPVPDGDYDVIATWPGGKADYLDLRARMTQAVTTIEIRQR